MSRSIKKIFYNKNNSTFVLLFISQLIYKYAFFRTRDAYVSIIEVKISAIPNYQANVMTFIDITERKSDSLYTYM